MLEVSYTAQIVPGFYLQPDFQYFWNPGGHVADPNDPAQGGAERGRARPAHHDQLLSLAAWLAGARMAGRAAVRYLWRHERRT